MPTILLVRHGETDYVGRRLAGHLPNVHLNQHGREQAEALAVRLGKLPITAIYSSPLERAIETAEPLASRLGLPIKILPALTEINVGDWQGKSLSRLRRLKLWKNTHTNPALFSFPNGESYPNKQKIICSALEELCRNITQKEIITCFSHGDPIKLSIAYYLGLDLNNFQRLLIDPASVSFVYRNGSIIRVGPINQIEKLFYPYHRE